MQYTMLIYETEADFDSRTSERKDAYWGAWRAYHQALVQAGVIAGGNALQPPATGTTVRVGGGKRHVQDGPFADTKEQVTGRTEWEAIALFYEELVRRAPTLGARVGRAAALGNARGAAAGLAALATIAPEPVGAYQPYWAVRAHLLAEAGAGGEAGQAYTRAIALSHDEAVRAFLLRRRGRVTAS